MKKYILFLLVGVLFTPITQAQHFFKFKVPQEKTYDDKVVFKCDDGYFTKNENGNYVVGAAKVDWSKMVYVYMSNSIVDSFNAYNLYQSVHVLADGHDFSISKKATWESIKILKGLSVRMMDEDKVIQEGEIIRLRVVVYRKEGTSMKTYSFKDKEKTLNLESLMREKGLENGDMLILTAITAEFPTGRKNVPGVTIQIVSQEDLREEEVTKDINKIDKTYKIYSTSVKGGYFIKGKVLENNHATFDEVNLGTSEDAAEVAKILKSAGIMGMVGVWEIYLPTGQLYARGTISYNTELSTYKLDNNWVLLNKEEALTE